MYMFIVTTKQPPFDVLSFYYNNYYVCEQLRISHARTCTCIIIFMQTSSAVTSLIPVSVLCFKNL